MGKKREKAGFCLHRDRLIYAFAIMEASSSKVTKT